MTDEKILKLKARDFIPVVGPLFYISRAGKLQEEVGIEKYQREIRSYAGLRGAGLLTYNLILGINLSAISKGIESLFN